MLANAGGPVGQMFPPSADLRKFAFIGTGVWLFFLIDVFKLPFQGYLGTLSSGSLAMSVVLMPVAMMGALLAPRLVRYVNELWFLRLVWFFIVVAGVQLVFF